MDTKRHVYKGDWTTCLNVSNYSRFDRVNHKVTISRDLQTFAESPIFSTSYTLPPLQKKKK